MVAGEIKASFVGFKSMANRCQAWVRTDIGISTELITSKLTPLKIEGITVESSLIMPPAKPIDAILPHTQVVRVSQDKVSPPTLSMAPPH